MRIKSLFLAAVFLFGLTVPNAEAQVQQSGSVTPGHVVCWLATGVVKDCGVSTAGTANTLGFQTQSTQIIGMNNAAPSGAHNRLTFGITGSQAVIGINAYNSASALPLNFDIHGTSYSIPDGIVNGGLDAISTTQGTILYRGASAWSALAVGTSGQVLTTNGAGANPSWTNAPGTGTVTSIDVSGGATGLTTSGGPITSSGTITIAGTLAVANGGTGATTAGGARTALGLGTSDSPQFTAIELGNVSDTTVGRVSAGVISVEGNDVPSPGSQAQGDVLYHNGTTWARLGAGTSGEFLQTQGAAANPQWSSATAAGGLLSIQVFTGNGTWTKPAGVNTVQVQVVGGGGGGADVNSSDDGSPGGGAAGCAIEIIDVSGTASETVTVGAAGAAGASGAGGNGGTTSFGAYVSATGGTGGPNSTSSAGGDGGSGSGGDINIDGGDGGGGNTGSSGADGGPGGDGGASCLGGGGSGAGSAGSGQDGQAYGSGGGGAVHTTGSGGAGKAGIVIVWEYS